MRRRCQPSQTRTYLAAIPDVAPSIQVALWQ